MLGRAWLTMMDDAEYDVLALLDFPEDHRATTHSIHVLERLNGEVKRHRDVVGIFPNENAIRWLVDAVVLE